MNKENIELTVLRLICLLFLVISFYHFINGYGAYEMVVYSSIVCIGIFGNMCYRICYVINKEINKNKNE